MFHRRKVANSMNLSNNYGKEVKDVFRRPSACVGVGSAR